MARIDHTNCTHPRTPAGRRGCRAAGTAAPAPDYIREAMHRTLANHKAKARMDRDYDVQAALIGKIKRRQATEAALRIQPRRSGARVAVDSSTCVQAALHTSRGLCACGHMTGEFRVAA